MTKIAGLYEVRRTLKDGSPVLNYRVKITRKNFKIDKLFNEDELEQAIELINFSKSKYGKVKITLLEDENKKQAELIDSFMKAPTLGFYIDKYLEIYVNPKLKKLNPEIPEQKFKIQNLRSYISIFNGLKKVSINKPIDNQWSLSPAIYEQFAGKQNLENFKPEEITEIEINEVVKELLKKIKPVSAKRYITQLSNVYRKIKQFDRSKRDLLNPCLNFDKDLLKINGNIINKKSFRFTDENKAILFKVLDEYSNPEMKQIVLLMLLTSLRRSEVIFLKWEQVDYKRKCLNLIFTKSGRNRTVHLIQPAIELLKSIEKKPNDDRLFTYSLTGFSSSLKRITKDYGLNFSGHDLRRESISMFTELIGSSNSLFIASYLGIAGIRQLEKQIDDESLDGFKDQKSLLKSVGHSSSEITLNSYFSLKK
jgi:integrase